MIFLLVAKRVGKKFCGLGSFGDVVWRLLCGSPILYMEKGNL